MRHVGQSLAAVMLLICGVFAAQAVEPAQLIPDSAIFYGEITKPDVLLQRALDPALFERFRETDGVRKYLESEDYQKLKGVIGLLEARLAIKWQTALSDLIGGGIHIGVAPQHEAVLLIVRSRNVELPERLNQAVIDLAKLDAVNRGTESAVKSKSHQDVTIWSFGKDLHDAVIGDLLIVSNKADGVAAAIDRNQQGKGKSLADLPELQQARALISSDRIGWAMARLAPVRDTAKVQKALASKSNNPAVELLLAGMIEAFRTAPVAVASLELHDDTLKLTAQAPLARSAISESRAWYFSPEDSTVEAAPLTVGGRIAELTAYRDVAGMWQQRDELFDENTSARLSKVDTDLGLFFSGRDFETEVLGELLPLWQFVVARQNYAADRPVPTVKLPAFAVVLGLKHPENFGPSALLMYQKLVGIYNIAGGQQGQPALLLTTADHRGVSVSQAAFLSSGDQPQAAAIHYNFNPSCAQVGDRFIIGSTADIVRQVIDSIRDAGSTSSSAKPVDNVLLEIDAANVAAALADNRDVLVSQNMLEEGHGRPEAEQQVDLLLELVRLVGKAKLQVSFDGQRIAITAAAGPEAN